MSDELNIQSYKGEYKAYFSEQISFDMFDDEIMQTTHFIVDQNVAEIYKTKLAKILKQPSTLVVEATEYNKSLSQFPAYVEHLVEHKVRRDHRLVAIGGGIIQDITCFLAATMLRGIEWWFFPTTLLAQADSCIGSKSSVNCNDIKNILGTFTPPRKVFICAEFLSSLEMADVKSGVGEMLKVHAIAGVEAFADIQKHYQQLFTDDAMMLHFIHRSLEIKKAIIEEDEFDKGPRNVMNYGHTFGHAIESATKYGVPHGVAVTIGMDMANYVGAKLDVGEQHDFERMHETLQTNYKDFNHCDIPIEQFITAISKDKKNRGKNQLGLILLDKTGKTKRVYLENSPEFKSACLDFIESVRA